MSPGKLFVRDQGGLSRSIPLGTRDHLHDALRAFSEVSLVDRAGYAAEHLLRGGAVGLGGGEWFGYLPNVCEYEILGRGG